MLSVLRRRNYSLFWAAALVSGIGDFVLLAALPYYVFAASGSALASAAAVVSETAPRVIFSNIGGVYADRWRRKPVIVACTVLQALFLLPLIAVHGPSTLWIVYLSGFLVATMGNFAGPFGGAAIPHVVRESELPSANAAFSVATWIGVVVGSPLGGFLLQRGGLTSVAIVDGTSFAISGILVALVDVPLQDVARLGGKAKASVRQAWRDWVVGAIFTTRDPWLTRFFVVVLLAFFSNGIITAILAPFIRHTLGGSAQFFGVCRTLQGVGGIGAAVTIGWISARFSSTTLLSAGLMGLGALNLVLAVFATQTVMLVNATISGFMVLFVLVSLTTLVQSGLPDEFRGRVFAGFMTTSAFASIGGALVGGGVGVTAGPRFAWALGGAAMLATGMVAVQLLPPRPAADLVNPANAPEHLA